MIRQTAIPLLLAAIFATWATPVMAESVVWQATAMSCTPTSTTAAEKKYVTTAGRIKFKDGQSGRISFICPVSIPSNPRFYSIQGTLTNPSFYWKKGNTLELRSAHKRTGAVSTVLSANIRSENNPVTKFGTVASAEKKYRWDNKNYYYWVSFSLSRPTSDGVSPAFLGMKIVHR